MPRLTDSPSGGKSEVLESIHYYGAFGAGREFFHIVSWVSRRWGGDETRGVDPTFKGDVATVLGELQTAGWVTANDGAGNAVDLTAGTPADTARIALTGAGRAAARHPRPRPQRIFE